MKKLLLLLSVALFSVGAMCQMTAREVIDRYNKLTGLDKVESAEDGMFMDLNIKTPLGEIPMQMIKGHKAQFRIEMTVMGQAMFIVTNGVEGWIKAADQPLQSMPKEALDALTSQGDVSSSFKIDDKQFDYKMISEKGKSYVISGTPRKSIKDLNIKDLTIYFDKKSGMMDAATTSIEQAGKVIDMNVKMSDYKDFGGILIPSVMVVQGKGVPLTTVVIRDLKIHYPTSASMFEKPE